MVKQPYTQILDLPYVAEIPLRLKERDVRTVLDLGCGSGWLSVYLSRQGFAVTGLDISEQAVRLAELWSQKENLSIRLEVGDIAEMNFANASFDAIVANSIFEHLTYDLAKAAITRLQAILVPGGYFIGCFDKVGGGPGEYFELADGTHVYTDKARQGMMLRYFSDDELKVLFVGWKIEELQTLETGSRFLIARCG